MSSTHVTKMSPKTYIVGLCFIFAWFLAGLWLPAYPDSNWVFSIISVLGAIGSSSLMSAGFTESFKRWLTTFAPTLMSAAVLVVFVGIADNHSPTAPSPMMSFCILSPMLLLTVALWVTHYLMTREFWLNAVVSWIDENEDYGTFDLMKLKNDHLCWDVEKYRVKQNPNPSLPFNS